MRSRMLRHPSTSTDGIKLRPGKMQEFVDAATGAEGLKYPEKDIQNIQNELSLDCWASRCVKCLRHESLRHIA